MIPDYLYELGRIDTSRPFAELEKLSLVNARAYAADKDLAFDAARNKSPIVGAERKSIGTAVVAGLRVKVDF